MNNDTLILLTNSFPYATGESFLETEILYLSKVFTTVYIIPTSNSAEKRKTPDNVIILDDFIEHRVSKVKRIALTLVTPSFWGAILQDYPKSLSIPYLKLNFIWSFNTDLMIRVLKKVISEKDIVLTRTVFYSYWFSSGANALAKLSSLSNNNLKTVTRVHGGDLYEAHNGFKTFPYRTFALKHIDKVYSISQDGVTHIQNLYGAKNVMLSRLGVSSYGKSEAPSDKNTLHVVSCSYISPVKRVYLIAKIIKELPYRSVKWTHFGKGEDKELEVLLPLIQSNITLDFKGQQSNQYILKYYTEYPIDLFINVSTSEGIPVSIMEAMSASIPVLATDVGGTSEIVQDAINGYLLNKDFKIEEAVEKIDAIKNNLSTFRNNAYKTWEQEYDAEKNYSKFTGMLHKIVKGKSNE